MTYIDLYKLEYLVAMVLCFTFLLVLKPIAVRTGLVDVPNTLRTHEHPVPLIGGISIFLSVSLALMLFDISLSKFRYLLFSLSLIVMVGVLDDYRDISPRW